MLTVTKLHWPGTWARSVLADLTLKALWHQCRLPGVQTWSSNWDVLLENTMDPSHACFLHDGVAGKWEDAAPLTMHLKDNKIDVNQVHKVPCANEVIRMLYLHWVLMLYMKHVLSRISRSTRLT